MRTLASNWLEWQSKKFKPFDRFIGQKTVLLFPRWWTRCELINPSALLSHQIKQQIRSLASSLPLQLSQLRILLSAMLDMSTPIVPLPALMPQTRTLHLASTSRTSQLSHSALTSRLVPVPTVHLLFSTLTQPLVAMTRVFLTELASIARSSALRQTWHWSVWRRSVSKGSRKSKLPSIFHFIYVHICP